MTKLSIRTQSSRGWSSRGSYRTSPQFFFLYPTMRPINCTKVFSYSCPRLLFVVSCSRQTDSLYMYVIYWICLEAMFGTILPCQPWCMHFFSADTFQHDNVHSNSFTYTAGTQRTFRVQHFWRDKEKNLRSRKNLISIFSLVLTEGRLVDDLFS